MKINNKNNNKMYDYIIIMDTKHETTVIEDGRTKIPSGSPNTKKSSKNPEINIEFNPDMRLSISVAIMGIVSVGKSTLMNSLFAQEYADMTIKRETMLPQIYQETEDDGIIDSKTIRKENAESNRRILNDAKHNKVPECKELIYHVPKVHDFIDNKRKYYLNIYDLPGIDDADLKDTHMDYLTTKFPEFDVILFMVDINSAFNTSNEVQIFRSVVKLIKRQITDFNKYVHLIICVNKCDDMNFDEKDSSKLTFINKEHTSMMHIIEERVNKIVDEERLDRKYCNNFVKICAEDSFIYRCINKNKNNKLKATHFDKLAIHDMGKNKWRMLSAKEKETYIDKLKTQVHEQKFYQQRMIQCGFKNFSNVIKRIIGYDNQYQFLINHVRNELNEIVQLTDENVFEIIKQYEKVYKKMTYIGKLFNNDDQKLVREDIGKKITTYIESIGKEDITNQEIAHKYAVYQQNLEYLIRWSPMIQKLFNVPLLLEKRTIICNKSIEYYLKVITEGTNFDSRKLKQYFSRLQECEYTKMTELVDTVNNKNVLLCAECFDKPEYIVEWCKYIRNELKYEGSKIKLFLENWLMAKQTHLRMHFSNKPEAVKSHFINYCYDLDYYLTQICCKIDLLKDEKYYKHLSIKNKKTIVLLHGCMGGVCYLKDTDNNLVVEKYLFDNFCI
jgi:small GTP-binding protein